MFNISRRYVYLVLFSCFFSSCISMNNHDISREITGIKKTSLHNASLPASNVSISGKSLIYVIPVSIFLGMYGVYLKNRKNHLIDNLRESNTRRGEEMMMLNAELSFMVPLIGGIGVGTLISMLTDDENKQISSILISTAKEFAILHNEIIKKELCYNVTNRGILKDIQSIFNYCCSYLKSLFQRGESEQPLLQQEPL